MEPNVELDLNVELNVDCLAQHSLRFGFRSSDSLLTRMLSCMLIVELDIEC